MHEHIKKILIDEVINIHDMCEAGEAAFGHDYEQSLNGSASYFEINGKRYKLELTCLGGI